MKRRRISALIAAAAARTACARRRETQTTTGSAAYDAVAQRRIAEECLADLQARIDDASSFAQITDVFAQLCAEPAAEEEILFEAGTFAFGGEPMFTVSLIRQIPNGADEFFQICADVSFRPDAENRGIEESKWFCPTDADAFSAVRQSDAFAYAAAHTAEAVELRLDET